MRGQVFLQYVSIYFYVLLNYSEQLASCMGDVFLLNVFIVVFSAIR